MTEKEKEWNELFMTLSDGNPVQFKEVKKLSIDNFLTKYKYHLNKAAPSKGKGAHS